MTYSWNNISARQASHIKIQRNSPCCALTIAGSDPTSGAGIQADLKTFAAHGVYGLSVIAAVTAQNTTGVRAIYPQSVSIVRNQCESLIEDIHFDVVKIGMLFSQEVVRYVAEFVRFHKLIAIVDTPLSAKDGTSLVEESAIEAYITHLFPVATLVTPNIPEAEKFLNITIRTREYMTVAAHKLRSLGASAVLVKGGHLPGEESADLYQSNSDEFWLVSPRIETPNTHGTGCTLSSAIAANCALGYTLSESVARAKEFMDQALSRSFSIGHGAGPLGHFDTTRTKPHLPIIV